MKKQKAILIECTMTLIVILMLAGCKKDVVTQYVYRYLNDTIYLQARDSDSISIPRSGLLAYFPFNGNANDESGHGLNGLVHGAYLTSDRFEKANSAYMFNGDSSYIDLGFPDSLKFATGSKFTISAWIYTNSNRLTQSIVSFGNHSYHLYLQMYDSCYLQWAAAQVVNTGVSYFEPVIESHKWYHIVAINYVGEYVKLYINADMKSFIFFPFIYNYEKNFTIGYTNSEGFFFNGKIDDILIYKRELTENEIKQLYNLKI